MRLLVALAQCLAVASAFAPVQSPLCLLRMPAAAAGRSSLAPLMMAKNSNKRKDGKVVPKASGGGFGVGASGDASTPSMSPNNVNEVRVAQSPAATRAERVDSVLRERGILPTDSRPVGQDTSLDPLARIPKKGQELLERFFGGGAILFGFIFIASGIAVSVEALCKVLDKPLPQFVDDFLVNTVEPILTPSILILFFFSISLGLLKQLQFSSESAGVLYREDDD
uniref:Uncharacterized protein n=2 Tax=Choreotrichia TaxID=141411 RepID=A0A7S3TW81_9SPIT